MPNERTVADLQASKAVDEAHAKLARALVADPRKPNVGLVFRNELQAAARALAAQLVVIYSALETASDAAVRDELVAALRNRVTAFVRSHVASRPVAVPVPVATREGENLIASLGVTVARDFDIAIHERVRNQDSGADPRRHATSPALVFDSDAVLASLWVLESEERSQQGTAFTLGGHGVVTCAHVLHDDTMAFRATDVAHRFPISVVACCDALDVAVIEVHGATGGRSLQRGLPGSLKHLDHLLVAGFPNYRFGDSGVTIPGLVIGFRPVSGVKRVITDAPIVAGNSGGPVLDRGSRVVGIAVTGSDSLETAHATENHGVIPIDVLDVISKDT